jgi:hypothetical protein
MTFWLNWLLLKEKPLMNGDNMIDGQSIDPRDQSPADFLERARQLSLSPRNARRWLALAIGRGEYDLAECGRRGILSRRFLEKTRELPRLRLE